MARGKAAGAAGKATGGRAGGLAAQFLDMVAAERGAAANTLDAYRRDLEDYLGFLGDEGADPLTVDVGVVRAWLVDLDERGLKASSAARRLSCIRGFHKFLYAEGLAETDPSAPVGGPRRGRTLPKVLSVAEVDDLLRTARERAVAPQAEDVPGERRRAVRMLCLLETLYATGLRVSELVALPRSAATTKQRYLVVKGKGGRERLVPLVPGRLVSVDLGARRVTFDWHPDD